MHGYSKISKIHSSRSKSLDFSDLTNLPQTQKSNENISPNYVCETEESKHSDNLKTKNLNNGGHFSCEIEVEDDESEEHDPQKTNSLKLSRNSTTGSQRFMRVERQSSKKSMQSAMKRAFSVSRSSSVSEKYSRIHEKFDSSPLNDDVEGNNNEEIEKSRSMKMKEKRSGGKRILKACRRLFGI